MCADRNPPVEGFDRAKARGARTRPDVRGSRSPSGSAGGPGVRPRTPCGQGSGRTRGLWSGSAACRSADFTGVVPEARLRRDAHGRPGDRFADRLGIRLIGLSPFDIRLDVGRRHQPHLMAKRGELPRPVMRARASLHADQAGRQAAEEHQHLRPPQLPSQDDLPARAHASFATIDPLDRSLPLGP